METNRHDIKANVGENFAIDKVLQNRDGSPYIISAELQNPYFLLSVSNTEYSQSERFFRNYWLSLRNFPKFYLTRPIDSSEINGWDRNSHIGKVQPVEKSLFDLIVACAVPDSYASKNESLLTFSGVWTWTDLFGPDKVKENKAYVARFSSNGREFSSITIHKSSIVGLNTTMTTLQYDDVLVLSIQTGEINNVTWTDDAYKSMDFYTYSELSITIDGELYMLEPGFAVVKDGDDYLYYEDGWKPYECRIIKAFLSNDTKDWLAQRYYYSLQLVYGTSNREQLEALADAYGISYLKPPYTDESYNSPLYKSNEELYNELVSLGHEFPEGYDYEIPVCNVNAISILSHAEITMTNYPQGGVFDV